MSHNKRIGLLMVTMFICTYIFATKIGDDTSKENAKYRESGKYEQHRVCKEYTTIWKLKE
jgi:hypothetical protein